MNSPAEPLTFVSLEAPSLATAFRIVQTAKTNRIVRKQNAENVHFFVRLALFHGGQVSTVHLVDLVDQKDFQDQVSIQEKLELYNILQDLRQPEATSRQSGRASATGGGSSASLSSAGKMVLSNFMIPLLTANAKTFLYANVIDSRTSLRESVQMLNAVANLRGFACVCRPLRGVSFEQLCFVASSSEPDKQQFPHLTEQSRRTSEVEILSRSPSLTTLSPTLINSEIPDKLSSFDQLSTLNGVVESEAMSWLNVFAQRKRDILGGSIDTIGTTTSAAKVPEHRVPDTASSSGFENRVESEKLHEDYTAPDTRPSITDLYEQLRESLEDVKEIESGKPENTRVSHCSLHSVPPHPESHTPLPIVDQSTEEDFAQVGYSRRTLGSILRHQTEQSQQLDEELTSWAPPVNGHPLTPLASYRDADSRPEVDSVEPAVNSAPPSIFVSAAGALAAMPPLASSKPDPFKLESLKRAGIAPCVMEPPNVDGLDVKTAQRVQAADATLLRKNYDALLSIVREQQQAKEAAEARAAEAIQDQEEMRAMDLNNKEEDLVATRLSKQRLSAEMNQAIEKADQLHHENEKLLQEKAATTEELLATRMYLASLENEKKKASILDRFVEKHGDRMSKLRQHGQFSSGSKDEGWHRDQFAPVKRSLPHAVPLCNKILRRLEMQELSLREFSEREVDFINLLVELVSDQPTVSLKQMIEQEMNKLQS
ncbi:Tuberin [Phytophthora nicotianae]|uniref:Tuberin n=1 Tax=Phytophthora nicotianae TaxID=4792 RepID=A0A0W8DM19_PHYNI|nr:Tuberin [Phytophthora nicotianae]